MDYTNSKWKIDISSTNLKKSVLYVINKGVWKFIRLFLYTLINAIDWPQNQVLSYCLVSCKINMQFLQRQVSIRRNIILKGQCHEKSFFFVLISVEHHIEINRQSVFSFLITCLVLLIFTVLKHANSLWCHLLTELRSHSQIQRQTKHYHISWATRTVTAWDMLLKSIADTASFQRTKLFGSY